VCEFIQDKQIGIAETKASQSLGTSCDKSRFPTPSGCSLIIITTNFSQVDFLLGHNNDQGAFNLSGLRKFLEENNIRLLADGGICNFFPNF
jgi:hypothetical protein